MVIRFPNGESYAVHFHYHETQRGKKPARRAVTVSLHPGKCPAERTRGTACHAEGLLVGTAECSPKDRWEPTKGRYLAFRRAVDNIQDKETKTVLWEQFNLTKGGRVPYDARVAKVEKSTPNTANNAA